MSPTVDKLMQLIDRAIEPKKMSANEALEVLELLRSEIDIRISALREDLGEDT